VNQVTVNQAAVNQAAANTEHDGAVPVCEDLSMIDRPPRVRANRVADVLADRIRRQILAGTLSDGERLPPIEVLMRQFGASVTAVREALRILESEGLVTVTRGKLGGAVVHAPDASTAAYTVALSLAGRGTRLGDVYEAQSFIEASCARLCAQRPDRLVSIVPALRAHHARAESLLDDPSLGFSKAMRSFHEALIEGCGNQTLAMLGGILESIYFPNNLGAAEDLGGLDDARVKAAKVLSLECHREICELIEAGDDLGVADKMAKHVVSHKHAGPDLVDEVVDPTVVRMSW
jgi:DNA-binding FadR family transcriptional regulator